MCSFKSVLVLFSVLVVLQITIEARSIRNEAIVKKKLEEVYKLYKEIKNNYFEVLCELDDDFFQNVTEIYKQGNAISEDLLNDLLLEILELQAEAEKQGVNVDECVKTAFHLMEVLPQALQEKMDKMIRNVMNQYEIMHAHFVNRANNVAGALNTLEEILFECPTDDEDCYEEVLKKAILLEQFLNNDFICDYETLIKDFLTSTGIKTETLKEDFNQLHKDIKKIEEDFLQCYKDQFP